MVFRNDKPNFVCLICLSELYTQKDMINHMKKRHRIKTPKQKIHWDETKPNLVPVTPSFAELAKKIGVPVVKSTEKIVVFHVTWCKKHAESLIVALAYLGYKVRVDKRVTGEYVLVYVPDVDILTP